MAERTIFDEIIDGTIPSRKVWEDENYLAFLTPFGNTPGATVVIPKKNPGDYVFGVADEAVSGLMSAAKKAANLLEKALGVSRVAAVFEGEAVPHLHIKLYPMHDFEADRSKFPKQSAFFPVYPGYISTAEGRFMNDEALDQIHQKIQEAAGHES
ncbi:MAG TPA: HIT family protein [Candidatus Saccharimonadales bacterium]|nr:HIT family protein [Candidatus Saccharimonadales bacterium]